MKIVPINNATHKTLRVRQSRNFAHAGNQHMAVLAAFEIMSTANNSPGVFAKHPDTGRFLCLAIFGLESGENLFFDNDGWKATYIPLNITRAPFAMCGSEKGGESVLICIDEDSPYISETEGAALFEENGDQTDFLSNVLSSMSDLASHERHTQLFVKKMVELRLLVPISVVISDSQGGSTELMDATYTISEGRLLELPNQQIVDLHAADYLGLAYSIVNSLEIFNRMIALRNRSSRNPVVNVSIKYSK
jgi:hypothetical protein